MIQNAIERSVLSAYFLQDLTDDAFKENCRKKLDIKSFILPIHKRLVASINKAIENNIPLPLLYQILLDKLEKDDRYIEKDDLLLVGATMPLSNSSGLDKYIEVLTERKIRRMI